MTEWRYVPKGVAKHALTDPRSTVAECGFSVWSADDWYGTGSQVEYEIAEALPRCARCARAIVGDLRINTAPIREADIETRFRPPH
jgi:hypothetical protein